MPDEYQSGGYELTAADVIQLAHANSIVDFGTSILASNADIQLVIQIAYLESTLGMYQKNPAPGNTASGVFQYNNITWESRHAALGSKEEFVNQLRAIFSDIERYRNWWNNPATNGNIPKDKISFEEYAYIKHHDGNGATDFLNSPGLQHLRTHPFTSPVASLYANGTTSNGEPAPTSFIAGTQGEWEVKHVQIWRDGILIDDHYRYVFIGAPGTGAASGPGWGPYGGTVPVGTGSSGSSTGGGTADLGSGWVGSINYDVGNRGGGWGTGGGWGGGGAGGGVGGGGFFPEYGNSVAPSQTSLAQVGYVNNGYSEVATLLPASGLLAEPTQVDSDLQNLVQAMASFAQQDSAIGSLVDTKLTGYTDIAVQPT